MVSDMSNLNFVAMLYQIGKWSIVWHLNEYGIQCFHRVAGILSFKFKYLIMDCFIRIDVGRSLRRMYSIMFRYIGMTVDSLQFCGTNVTPLFLDIGEGNPADI